MLDKIKNIFNPPPPSLEEQLVTHGQTFIASFPSTTFKALPVPEGLLVTHPTTLVPGMTVNTAGASIITGITQHTPELSLLTLAPMPLSVSILIAQAYGKTLDGRDKYRIISTQWRNIPAALVEPDTYLLSKSYVPDRGDLILHDGQHHRITSVNTGPVYTVCVTEAF
jgi:hypothetical protein